MPNCIKCGAALPPGAVFCPACGKKQASGARPRSRRTRPSGTGSVYRRGKTWECAYVHGYVVQEDGKVKAIRSVKGGFPTKKAAMEYLPTLTQEPPRKIPTLQDLYSIFTHSRSYEEIVRKDKYTIAWNKVKRLWFRRIDRITAILKYLQTCYGCQIIRRSHCAVFSDGIDTTRRGIAIFPGRFFR